MPLKKRGDRLCPPPNLCLWSGFQRNECRRGFIVFLCDCGSHRCANDAARDVASASFDLLFHKPGSTTKGEEILSSDEPLCNLVEPLPMSDPPPLGRLSRQSVQLPTPGCAPLAGTQTTTGASSSSTPGGKKHTRCTLESRWSVLLMLLSG